MSRTRKASPPQPRERHLPAPAAIPHVPHHVGWRATLENTEVWRALEDLYLSIPELGASVR